MRSIYAEDCPKHPELAGRRYLPNKVCIKCHSDAMKVQHAKRKARHQAQEAQRLRALDLLREVRNAYGSYVSLDDLFKRIEKELNHEIQ